MSHTYPTRNRSILLVSKDVLLLRTRTMILGAFFNVESAGRISEAEGLVRKHSFDLIVLCDSLSFDEGKQLAHKVRQVNPSAMVLAMNSTDNTDVKTWADKQLELDAGPFGLVKACATMLGYVLRSKTKAHRAIKD